MFSTDERISAAPIHSRPRWIETYRRRSAKGDTMYHDVLRTRWKQFRRELSYRWKHLTSDELDDVQGKRDHLIVLLERRYGYARRRAEREVDLFVDEFADRLRRAA